MNAQARFEKYVDRTGDCWLWTGGTNPSGYGHFRVGPAQRGAHRWAWEWTHGPIPEDMVIHHVCRTRRCVNPAHLELVTRKRNLQQRWHDTTWATLVRRIDEPPAEPLNVTLSPELSGWVQARALETGLPVDEIIQRALYRYMAQWLANWQRAPKVEWHIRPDGAARSDA